VRPLGRFGIWAGQLDALPYRDAVALARGAEALGLSALWFPESVGREALSQAALLLDATERITVATGVANIWARDAVAARNGARALGEAHPGRFVLGLGVSHAPLVGDRGGAYRRPLEAMTHYLDRMAEAPYRGPEPPVPVPVVLAALGPRMLALARDRAAGAHTFCAPPEHTRRARQVLGDGPCLAAHQAVLPAGDRERDLHLARAHLRRYLALPNYRRNLERLGWEPAAMDAPVDEALVDALVAIGGTGRLASRVLDHLDAGADHVALQVLGAPGPGAGDAALEVLAGIRDELERRERWH
jgi:probable F420-dependent oxidoreductase